jgi:hypothetical protein
LVHQPKKAGLPTAAVSRDAGSESEISFGVNAGLKMHHPAGVKVHH